MAITEGSTLGLTLTDGTAGKHHKNSERPDQWKSNMHGEGIESYISVHESINLTVRMLHVEIFQVDFFFPNQYMILN
jgi:hypothetical protein